MGLLDRCKKIVDIKIDKRKGQSGGAPEGDIGPFGSNDAISEGSIGSLDGLDFTVLGKLVYDWGGGYWEEFYLEFLDTEEHKWLSKEGTTIELLEEIESIGSPDPENLKEGDLFELQGEKVRVNEVGEARITSVSGSFHYGRFNKIATVTSANSPWFNTGSNAGGAAIIRGSGGAGTISGSLGGSISIGDISTNEVFELEPSVVSVSGGTVYVLYRNGSIV